MLELVGVTARDTTVGGVTVREAVPMIDFKLALITAVPADLPWARPLARVATVLADDVQVADLVRSCRAPLL